MIGNHTGSPARRDIDLEGAEMSWIGIGRGVVRIVEGISEGDAEKAAKGAGGALLSVAAEVVKAVHSEEAGEAMSEKDEQLTEDV
jgi:hypothetical protein